MKDMKTKGQSTLRSAMLEQSTVKKTSPWVSLPVFAIGVVLVVFGLVKLVKFAWFF